MLSSSLFRTRPWLNENGAASMNESGLKGLVAGCITGGVEICLTYPSEYIKTHLQIDGKGSKKKYDGIIDCVVKTVKKYGIFGLYRGLPVLLVGTLPKTAVRFGSFETMKSYSMDTKGHLDVKGKLYCGLTAGIMESILVVTPMETVKTRFINDIRSENPRYKGYLDGVKIMFKEEGWRGIYKGVTATTLKQGSNQAIRFFIIESAREYYKDNDDSVRVPKWFIGISGACAGATSVLCNTPVDVLKTRMQRLESRQYRNTLDCAIKLYNVEGIKGFYKGTIPRLFRSSLDVSLTFMIYDSVIDLFAIIWP